MHPEIEAVLDDIDTVLVGKRDAAQLLLCAMLAAGHVLLEDIPGVGKTTLARTVALTLGLVYRRIQFTPDLLPSDITGVNIFLPEEGRFRFQPGPLFANLVLADEINRTAPRTQSALLEAMEESHVTVDGTEHSLKKPFIVIATQNPADFAGTFPLPDSQLDRFLFRLALGYPTPEEELEILSRHGRDLPTASPVLTGARFLSMMQEVQSIYVSVPVRQYMVAISQRTRHHPDLERGISPRATLGWLRAAQAWAFMHRRSFVVPDDIRLVAPYALEHRLMPRGGSPDDRRHTVRDIVKSLLKTVPAPRWDRPSTPPP